MFTIQQVTAKPEIKLPGEKLLAAFQPLPAMLEYHSGPVLGSSYHTACLIVPKGATEAFPMQT